MVSYYSLTVVLTSNWYPNIGPRTSYYPNTGFMGDVDGPVFGYLLSSTSSRDERVHASRGVLQERGGPDVD